MLLTEADDTTNISTYSWNIAFRQLKFLQKGGSPYTPCRLIVGTVRYMCFCDSDQYCSMCGCFKTKM